MSAPIITPPLSAVTPAEQQIQWLDVMRSDRTKYLSLLRRLLDEVGGDAFIRYSRTGRELILGVRDGDFIARMDRARLLVAHAKDNGLLIDLMADIEADGLVAEMRDGDMRSLALTMKRFLHTGSAIYLTPEGELEESGGMPAEWCRRGPGALAIENAAREWLTIRRLPGMDAWAERFVRKAGYRRDRFIILEKKS